MLLALEAALNVFEVVLGQHLSPRTIVGVSDNEPLSSSRKFLEKFFL
jgi:hypothetical protein